MEIKTSASVQVPREVGAVFDFATDPRRISTFMKPKAPIPGVDGVTVEGDGVSRPGARRRVAMSDGSVMGEEVLTLDRPRAHAYRWLNPPKAPFSWLVKGASAEWTFAPEGGGTRVDWVYTFELTSALAYPFAALVVKLFQGWMSQALRGIDGAMRR